jgi:hypothetical protein
MVVILYLDYLYQNSMDSLGAAIDSYFPAGGSLG